MTTAEASVHHWSELPSDKPMPLLERRRIVGMKVMLSEITLHAGCEVPVHAHENEQMACVLSGRVRFRLPQPDGTVREVELTAGDVMHAPPNVPHGVLALAESVLLDAFSPVSATTGIDAGGDGRGARSRAPTTCGTASVPRALRSCLTAQNPRAHDHSRRGLRRRNLAVSLNTASVRLLATTESIARTQILSRQTEPSPGTSRPIPDPNPTPRCIAWFLVDSFRQEAGVI